MADIEAAHKFMQRVFDGNTNPSEVDAFINGGGYRGLHLVIYDGGYTTNPQIRKKYTENPTLQYLVEQMIMARIAEGSSEKTARRMYNFE